MFLTISLIHRLKFHTMLQMKRREVDEEINNLIEVLLSKFKQLRQGIQVDLERVDLAIQGIEQSRLSIISDTQPSTDIPMNNTLSPGDWKKLKDSGWNEIFLMGLRQAGGSAPLSVITKRVSSFPINIVQERVANKTLIQVLRVHGETLLKNGLLHKAASDKRKGGVIYQLIK